MPSIECCRSLRSPRPVAVRAWGRWTRADQEKHGWDFFSISAPNQCMVRTRYCASHTVALAGDDTAIGGLDSGKVEALPGEQVFGDIRKRLGK